MFVCLFDRASIWHANYLCVCAGVLVLTMELISLLTFFSLAVAALWTNKTFAKPGTNAQWGQCLYAHNLDCDSDATGIVHSLVEPYKSFASPAQVSTVNRIGVIRAVWYYSEVLIYK